MKAINSAGTASPPGNEKMRQDDTAGIGVQTVGVASGAKHAERFEHQSFKDVLQEDEHRKGYRERAELSVRRPAPEEYGEGKRRTCKQRLVAYRTARQEDRSPDCGQLLLVSHRMVR